MIDLAHLERLLAEATPAPWPALDLDDSLDDDAVILIAKCDIRLYVAAVNALPELIAAARERDRLQRQRDAIEAAWQVACDENAKLRAVVEAARKMVEDEVSLGRFNRLVAALAALDEKEGT